MCMHFIVLYSAEHLSVLSVHFMSTLLPEAAVASTLNSLSYHLALARGHFMPAALD